MQRGLLAVTCLTLAACGARSALEAIDERRTGSGGGLPGPTGAAVASSGGQAAGAGGSLGVGGSVGVGGSLGVGGRLGVGGSGGGPGTTTGTAGAGGGAPALSPCPVTSCAVGSCPPVALAQGTSPVWIGLLGSTVLWDSDESAEWLASAGVHRVEKNGLGAEQLWSGYYGTGNAGLDPDAVYLGVLQGHAGGASVPNLLRIPTAGGPVQMLATFAHTEYPLSAAVAGADLYYGSVEASGVALHRVGTDGTGNQVLASGLTETMRFNQSLAVDDTFVYLVDGSQGGRIVRVPRAGGAIETVASSMSDGPIALDGDFVYQGGYFTQQGIYRFPKAGGAGELVVPGIETSFLAVYGDYLYFIVDHDNTLDRAPKAGGAAETLVTGAIPVSVAADAIGVYYGDDQNGMLCRLAF